MRICLISREYPPETHVGGIASYTHKTAAALARLGHEVHVVTSSWKPGAEYEENGAQVHRFAERPAKPRRAQSLLHTRIVAQTVASIPGPLDLVQACEWDGEAFWYGLTPGRQTPLVTRLATPHFLVKQLNQHSYKGMQGTLSAMMERHQTLRSDGIISPTRALATIVCRTWKIDPQRVVVVPTGMDLTLARDNADGPRPEALQGIDYVLYFGRLEERKGVQVLGEALPKVLAASPGLRAVFVGDDMSYGEGSMREAIQKMNAAHAQRLVFLPRMPQRDLFPIIKAARLVVLPSLWENLANTCLEAMQLGRPVIGTRHCGFEEVIEDGVSGFLVEPGDVAGLAQRMIEALGDLQLLERVGTGALHRMEDFSIDAMAERLVDYYGQVVDRWRRLRRLAPPGAVGTKREQDAVEVLP